jgi:drug/metabolite transporter (DMT)-like permease
MGAITAETGTGGTKLRDWTLLLFCNLVWASQFVLVKLVQDEIGPVFTTAFPMLLATALLVPVVAVDRRRRAAAGGTVALVGRRDVVDFLVIGVVGQVVAQLFVTWGTQRSLASNGAVLMLTLPVATAVIAYLVLRERMTTVRWLSFVLAIAGVLVTSLRDLRGFDLAGRGTFFGNVLIFVGVLGSAFYNVYSKKLLERFGPLEVLLYSYYAVCAFLLPITLALEPEGFRHLATLSLRAWFGLGALAVLQYFLSMVVFLTVLARLDATQAALSNYMIPVFGVVLAWAFGESLTPLMLAGGVLVLGSTLLVTVYEERLAARARAAAVADALGGRTS